MKTPQPTFPPLLTGHKLDETKNPFNWAKSRAAKGKLEAGDLAWSPDANAMRFALVLEPEVQRERAGEMLYLLVVAFGDAAGALCPPEISIQYRWPSAILMNGATIGSVDLTLSENDSDGVPDWLVLGIEVDIKPRTIALDPGAIEDKTTFWDEGCGDITRTELIESASRHTINWIHTWGEEGFKPVYDSWWGRLSDGNKLGVTLRDHGELIGLDESGNAIVSANDTTSVVMTLDALQQISSAQ